MHSKVPKPYSGPKIEFKRPLRSNQQQSNQTTKLLGGVLAAAAALSVGGAIYSATAHRSTRRSHQEGKENRGSEGGLSRKNTAVAHPKPSPPAAEYVRSSPAVQPSHYRRDAYYQRQPAYVPGKARGSQPSHSQKPASPVKAAPLPAPSQIPTKRTVGEMGRQAKPHPHNQPVSRSTLETSAVAPKLNLANLDPSYVLVTQPGASGADQPNPRVAQKEESSVNVRSKREVRESTPTNSSHISPAVWAKILEDLEALENEQLPPGLMSWGELDEKIRGTETTSPISSTVKPPATSSLSPEEENHQRGMEFLARVDAERHSRPHRHRSTTYKHMAEQALEETITGQRQQGAPVGLSFAAIQGLLNFAQQKGLAVEDVLRYAAGKFYKEVTHKDPS
ncbi:MAG: hypothetical protein C5B47_01480, partial [Verrucomicrobia bacterium]